MKRLLNFILKKKVIDLDNDGKIESLRQEVEGVFGQFKRMSDRLDTVNGALKAVIEEEKLAKEVEEDALKRVIEEANRKLQAIDKRVEKAELEIQMNTKLQEKVSEFIK